MYFWKSPQWFLPDFVLLYLCVIPLVLQSRASVSVLLSFARCIYHYKSKGSLKWKDQVGSWKQTLAQLLIKQWQIVSRGLCRAWKFNRVQRGIRQIPEWHMPRRLLNPIISVQTSCSGCPWARDFQQPGEHCGGSDCCPVCPARLSIAQPLRLYRHHSAWPLLCIARK